MEKQQASGCTAGLLCTTSIELYNQENIPDQVIPTYMVSLISIRLSLTGLQKGTNFGETANETNRLRNGSVKIIHPLKLGIPKS